MVNPKDIIPVDKRGQENNLSFSPVSPDGPPPPDSPEPERGRTLPGFVRAKRPDP